VSSSRRIPNQFHFIYGLRRRRQPFHLIHYLCLRSCLEVNRPDAVYVHYHREPRGRYWELIKPSIVTVQVEPVPFVSRYRYRDRFTARYRYAHHADFVRLQVLCRHGGVYADLDTIFVNPLPEPLFEESFVIGREPDVVDQRTGRLEPSLCNAFLMSEPGAPFAMLWLDEIEATFDGSWSAHSTLLPERLRRQHPRLLHVEPPRSFYKHSWTREGIRGLLESRDTDFEGVYSLHLWAHLWWLRRRRDLSSFNAPRLTEEYVRRGETTYAIAARPFLPPPSLRGERVRSLIRRQRVGRS
jgi:hypothetical protein